MSTRGWSGRNLKIRKAGDVIAAVRTKTVTHGRDPIDATTDDTGGDRVVLSEPSLRYLDVTVEGVVTSDNLQDLLADWNGDTWQDISIEHPDGTIEEAEDGFFLGNLEFSGEHTDLVSFSATLQSSGPLTITS